VSDGTTALLNDLVDAMVNDQNVYLALYADETTELSATGYARQLVQFPAAVNGETANDVTGTFGPFTGAGGPVTHWALWSASSGGTRRTAIQEFVGGALEWADGGTLEFPPGAITVSIA